MAIEKIHLMPIAQFQLAALPACPGFAAHRFEMMQMFIEKSRVHDVESFFSSFRDYVQCSKLNEIKSDIRPLGYSLFGGLKL